MASGCKVASTLPQRGALSLDGIPDGPQPRLLRTTIHDLTAKLQVALSSTYLAFTGICDVSTHHPELRELNKCIVVDFTSLNRRFGLTHTALEKRRTGATKEGTHGPPTSQELGSYVHSRARYTSSYVEEAVELLVVYRTKVQEALREEEDEGRKHVEAINEAIGRLREGVESERRLHEAMLRHQ